MVSEIMPTNSNYRSSVISAGPKTTRSSSPEWDFGTRYSFSRVFGGTLIKWAPVIAAILCSCAGPSKQFDTRVMYSARNFSGEDLSGHTILQFPLMAPQSMMDRSGHDLLDTTASRIGLIRSDLSLRDIRDFESPFVRQYGPEALKSFYGLLRDGNVIAVQGADSVWGSIPGKYALSARLLSGARIRTFGDRQYRSIILEAELWDIRRAEVVWRGRVSGRDSGRRSSDSDFLAACILELYADLPSYHSIPHSESW